MRDKERDYRDYKASKDRDRERHRDRERERNRDRDRDRHSSRDRTSNRSRDHRTNHDRSSNDREFNNYKSNSVRDKKAYNSSYDRVSMMHSFKAVLKTGKKFNRLWLRVRTNN